MILNILQHVKLPKITNYVTSLSRLSTITQRKTANNDSRVRLAAAYRGLDQYGLNEGICNHLSAVAPSISGDGDVMLIIPFGLHWKEVTPSLLIGVNEKNEVVEGNGEPEITALCIHRGIYSQCPNVKCVMHTHMPYATALTCLHNPEVLMIHQNSARFHNRIAYDTSYGGLGDSFLEGKRLAQVIGNKDVLFMCNHGVMTVAQSIAIAFDNMYYLERAAMIQVLAHNTQKTLREIEPEIVDLTSKQIWSCLDKYAESHLNVMIRRLRTISPEFSV
ncbi:Adducin-related protein, partial [Stegodyphus mimosarum]